MSLLAVGCLLAALSTVAWAGPASERGAVEAQAHSAAMPALTGLWAAVQAAWSEAVEAWLGWSAAYQAGTSSPAVPVTGLDGGATCQEPGTWQGCDADPDG
jgi:hypothetical protein